MLKKALTSFFRTSFNPFPFISLSNTIQYSFARRIKEKKSLEAKIKEPEPEPDPEPMLKQKPEKAIKKEQAEKFSTEERILKLRDNHEVENRMDPNDPDIDDEFMSKSYLNTQHLPKDLLKRAHQVFSKFPHQEVRKMGIAYARLYQLLHASEKPTDLTSTKPFANTEDLTASKQALVYLGKKRRHDEACREEDIEKSEAKKERLQKGKAEEPESREKKADQGIEYDQNMAIAYLQRRMPHTFGVACRILTEIRYRLPDFEPKTFLDFGAGLGNMNKAHPLIFRFSILCFQGYLSKV